MIEKHNKSFNITIFGVLTFHFKAVFLLRMLLFVLRQEYTSFFYMTKN